MTPLLGYILSSANQDELRFLGNQHVPKNDHLGRQSLDLGPGLHLLMEQILLRPLRSL
jgi:hypothetical protein